MGILRYAASIFGNSQYDFTGKLKDNDIQAVEKIHANNPLIETQKKFLNLCNQGEFLADFTNSERFSVSIVATPLELYYMGETDNYPLKNEQNI